MAAKEMQFPWRWNGGTISLNLGVIWENVGLICINDSWDNSCLAFKKHDREYLKRCRQDAPFDVHGHAGRGPSRGFLWKPRSIAHKLARGGQKMLSQSRNVFICALSLVLSAASISHAFDENALVEEKKALGLVQDDVTSWQDGNQPAPQSLDLNISREQIGGVYETVDDDEQNSARRARIASCYEASIGRYHSEERGAFTNTLSEFSKFEAAMTPFNAQRDSRLQFESCSRL